MNPHSPAQKLLATIEAATTERQFAIALADYRAPRRVRRDGRIQRVPRNEEMPSLRDLELEPYRELPGRNNICKWENGDGSVSFTEPQLRVYLSLCKITGELFEACIYHYRRIIQQGTNGGQDTKESFPQQDILDTSGIDLNPANFRCQADLVHCLQTLYYKTGRIPYCELSERTGGDLSAASIGDLIGKNSKIKFTRIPWRIVELFVLACGAPEADLKKWRKAWEVSVTEADIVDEIYTGLVSCLEDGISFREKEHGGGKYPEFASKLWPGGSGWFFTAPNHEFQMCYDLASIEIGGKSYLALQTLLRTLPDCPVSLDERDHAVMKILGLESSEYFDRCRKELLYTLATKMKGIYIADNLRASMARRPGLLTMPNTLN
jgi:hypothetical protein